MKLFDAHCHLQDERLAPHLGETMARAERAGVAGSMCCGSSEADWPLLPDVALRFPGVRLSFGLHPWYTESRSGNWLADLRTFLERYPAGVGEIGLDHALDKATFADQEEVFLAQIRLANELQRPASIHCRRAWGRLMELLDDRGWPACGFVIHSYSGSSELIAPLARRGAFFSFSGAITSEQNRRARETVTLVPGERLLIETDAPDMPPALPPESLILRDPEGKPLSEPAHLALVAETVALLRGTDTGTIAAISFRNAMELWGP